MLLQDELYIREENDAEANRKPHPSSGTSPSFSYAMVVDDMLAVFPVVSSSSADFTTALSVVPSSFEVDAATTVFVAPSSFNVFADVTEPAPSSEVAARGIPSLKSRDYALLS